MIETDGMLSQIEVTNEAILAVATNIRWGGGMGGATQTSFIAALDPGTGRELWRTEPEEMGSRWRTAKVSEAGLFALSVVQGNPPADAPKGKLSLLDPKNGKALWEVEPPGGYAAVFEPVDGGLLLAGTGNKAAGGAEGFARLHDARDGSVRWDAAAHVPAGSVTRVQRIPDRGLLLAGIDEKDQGWMMLLDVRTGKPLWEKKPGSLPGKPATVQFQDGEIWIRGDGAAEGGVWAGAYAVDDGKARAEATLEGAPQIQAFQFGAREILAWSHGRGGINQQTALDCFDLKTGAKRWTKEVSGWMQTVKLLPSGLLLGGAEGENHLEMKGFLGLYRLDGLWQD